MVVTFGFTQPFGLAEDGLDHRLNSRTVYIDPVLCLGWNVNYHVQLRLPAAIKADCPPPFPNCLAAYKEIVSAVRRRMREPGLHAVRALLVGHGAVPCNSNTRIVATE